MATKTPKTLAETSPEYAAALAERDELTARANTLYREKADALAALNALVMPPRKMSVDEAADELLARRARADEVKAAAVVLHRKVDDIEFELEVVQRAIGKHTTAVVGPARRKALAAVLPAVRDKVWAPAVRRAGLAMIEAARARAALDDLRQALQDAELYDGEALADPTPFGGYDRPDGQYGPLGSLAKGLVAGGFVAPDDPGLAGVRLDA